MNPTYTKSLFTKLTNSTNPIVFLDVTFSNKLDTELNTTDIHRLYFELFLDITPLTAENFRQFCTGQKINPTTKKPYGYKNTHFTRLIKNCTLQGGDFINYDGTGEYSIYGSNFDDENFILSHDGIGYLSMANSGKNTNGCQFFITLDSCKEFDGENVVFGKIIDDYSVKILKIINEIQSRFEDDLPLVNIKILNCGQM